MDENIEVPKITMKLTPNEARLIQLLRQLPDQPEYHYELLMNLVHQFVHWLGSVILAPGDSAEVIAKAEAPTHDTAWAQYQAWRKRQGKKAILPDALYPIIYGGIKMLGGGK